MSGTFQHGACGALVAASLVLAPGIAPAWATDEKAPTGEAGIDSNDPAAHDPMEDVNRAIFEVNGVFYEITTPVVEATPGPIKGLFKAFGTALTAPVKIVTNIVTGDPTKTRLADIAAQEDVDCGYFIVLPFAGPTTSRDAVGTGVEMAANPGTYIFVVGAGGAVSERYDAQAQIRQLDGAVDEYALARSATLQDRGCIVSTDDEGPMAFDLEEKPAETEEASTAQ